MLIRVKRFRLSHNGRIYRQGETVELADSIAKKLLTSDNFEAVGAEPSNKTASKATSKNTKTTKAEPVEVDEAVELPDVDPAKAVVK